MGEPSRAWNPYPAERPSAEDAPFITREFVERATRAFLAEGGRIRHLNSLPDRITAARYKANREAGTLPEPLSSLDNRDEL